MARTGRPRSENPKHRIISMRMSDQEYREVREFASKHNLTVSETLLLGFQSLKKLKEIAIKRLFLLC